MSDEPLAWGHASRLLQPLVIPWADRLMLAVPPEAGEPAVGRRSGAFPTARIARGLLICHRDLDLCEEGVGFGVPILMRGLVTVFPGARRCSWVRRAGAAEVTLDYEMNLAERLTRGGTAALGPALLWSQRAAAALHRRLPLARGALSGLSTLLRSNLSIETGFREVASEGTCTVHYTIEPRGGACSVAVRVSTAGLNRAGLTEIVVMNELGARSFDRYRDSSGRALDGARIGTWDEVTADRAEMVSAGAGVSFALERRAGARLMRGREIADGRLAWAGFGYRLPPEASGIRYRIDIARVP